MNVLKEYNGIRLNWVSIVYNCHLCNKDHGILMPFLNIISNPINALILQSNMLVMYVNLTIVLSKVGSWLISLLFFFWLIPSVVYKNTMRAWNSSQYLSAKREKRKSPNLMLVFLKLQFDRLVPDWPARAFLGGSAGGCAQRDITWCLHLGSGVKNSR